MFYCSCLCIVYYSRYDKVKCRSTAGCDILDALVDDLLKCYQIVLRLNKAFKVKKNILREKRNIIVGGGKRRS